LDPGLAIFSRAMTFSMQEKGIWRCLSFSVRTSKALRVAGEAIEWASVALRACCLRPNPLHGSCRVAPSAEAGSRKR
jgi:hypothetical protein